MRRRYNNKKHLNCEVEVISNLKFYESQSNWFIGYSTRNENGYCSMKV